VSFPFIFFFVSTGVWNQGLMLASSVLYHLSHSATPVLCCVFQDWGFWTTPPLLSHSASLRAMSLFAFVLYSLLCWPHNSPQYIFFSVLGFELRANSLSHSTSPFFEGLLQDRILRTTCPGWLWTVILLISATWVTRVTGVSHHWCQATSVHFYSINEREIKLWLFFKLKLDGT
jgi:hypothetical protein